MKIDVCLVTKNMVTTIKGIEYIPCNNLIVETSKPLALARMKAIQKVKTEWFAFIDDDVEIDKTWFEIIKPLMKKNDIGAIQGNLLINGLGVEWDKVLNSRKVFIQEFKLGERGCTHNTLIRTALVKDWIPPPNLSAWEDYSLTQHIFKKGYRWVVIPTKSYHTKTWKKIWKNIFWGIEGENRFFPSRKHNLIRIIKMIARMLRAIISPKKHWRLKFYLVFGYIGRILAYTKYFIKPSSSGELFN